MPLFEVAILEKPTPDGAKAGQTEKLVFGPKSVVAQDAGAAALAAVLADGAGLKDVDKNRIEVLVRPFA